MSRGFRNVVSETVLGLAKKTRLDKLARLRLRNVIQKTANRAFVRPGVPLSRNVLLPEISEVTPDQYLNAILTREAVDKTLTSPARKVQLTLGPVLKAWGGKYLQKVSPSGSFAKGTANRSGTDIDLFLSLAPETPDTLKNVHDTLFVALKNAGHAPRRQEVSLGVRVGGTDVDLVPAKQQSLLSQAHSLYRRKTDSWTKTNVETHIAYVVAHQRQMETRVLKLWRNQHGLEFPSFYLEMAVIEALKKSALPNLESRVLAVLRYLGGDFTQSRFVDPANTNNIISDEVTANEKAAIKASALRSLQAQNWGEIVK